MSLFKTFLALLTLSLGMSDLWSNIESNPYTVKKQRLKRVLREKGTLAPRQSHPIAVQASGDIIELMKSGLTVQKDQVLIRQDLSDVQDQYENQIDSQSQQELTLKAYDLDLELTKYRGKLELQRDQASLKHAKLALKVKKRGLDEEELRLQEIDIELSKLDLEEAQEAYQREKRMLDKGYISKTMLEPFEQRVEVAKVRLSELKLKKELNEQGVAEDLLLESQEEVSLLEKRIERAEKARQRRLGEIEKRKAVEAQRIERTKYNIKGSEEQLVLADTLAPTDGILVVRMYKDWTSGGRWTTYRPGIKKWRGDIIADVIDPKKMKVDLMIHEADFRLLKKGLKATIKLPALPGESFPGVLSELGAVGRDRYELAALGQENSHTGITMFNATVDLEEAIADFHPGMSALVEIEIENPVALSIPKDYIEFGPKGAQVWVLQNSQKVPTPIRGNLFNDHWYIVTEGLKENDTIVKASQSS